MKKTYMTPALEVQYVQFEQMIALSITGVGGNSGIGIGKDDDLPEEADVKGNPFGDSIFD
jgi:hypothetical protein